MGDSKYFYQKYRQLVLSTSINSLSDRSSVGVISAKIAIFMTILEAVSGEKSMQRLCI
ncbi:hypothetical protein IQ275_29995 [Nostoc sp. LEGE 12450]|nr:hypothetical protein [Nostoc sp. LEGE 12450]